MNQNIATGNPYPLGATWDGKGVNFALYTENAEKVALCLFDKADDVKPSATIVLQQRSLSVWHVYVAGLKPGQLYAYRVWGKYDPRNGLRFNHNKLLLDPYAKAITGDVRWNDAVFGYQIGHADEDLSFNEADSAPYMPRCVVVDEAFDWGDDRPPSTSYDDTVIYETHVKGFTNLCPGIPASIRGTFAAIAHEESIQYLKQLGVTAVELMPVHHFVNDRYLLEKGLSNYWGYNTIGFFAPHAAYSSSGTMGGQVNEFKQMVKALHAAGLELILDVVYNHTAEGNHMGPTLSFRGIENLHYYHLAEDLRYYMDYTGTGNTLNTTSPDVLRMVMDSLRYWITEMHVDGFRFDLAAALSRDLDTTYRKGSFFDIIYQDPVISRVKLIAEPWDTGNEGYQVGNFPPGWGEWNDKYRDGIRDFWRGTPGMLGEFGRRFTGSADLYQNGRRKPSASVNFITAHDGFTLADLVSYNEAHNEANKEENSYGVNNHSWNCGEEGPTDNEEVLNLRKRQQRNFLATLLLSQGMPMLRSGDEMGHSQQGNNNAYCQDNELSWLQWEKADKDLLEFTRQLIALRKMHPVLSRKRWIGDTHPDIQEIEWLLPDGNTMTEQHWTQPEARAIGIYLNGNSLPSGGGNEKEHADDHFYFLFNASEQDVRFTIPPERYGRDWHVILDTHNGFNKKADKVLLPGNTFELGSRTVMVLQCHRT